MVTKAQTAKIFNKQEYIKHPFSKKRLLILDIFNINIAPCEGCLSDIPSKVTVVAADFKLINEYQVVDCQSCALQTWYISI